MTKPEQKGVEMTLPKPKAVLFDWDGTIVDSMPAIIECNRLVRDHFGDRPLTLDELHEAMKAGPAKAMFAALYPNDPEKAQVALDFYYTHVPDVRARYVTFLPDVQKVFVALQSAGIKMGVVSNMSHPHLVREVHALDHAHYFDTIIGAGEAARGKPSPDPIYLAFDRLGLSRTDAAQVWFVGDMEPDARAARAAGCPFILYDPAGKNGHLKPDVTIADYAALDKMIKEITT